MGLLNVARSMKTLDELFEEEASVPDESRVILSIGRTGNFHRTYEDNSYNRSFQVVSKNMKRGVQYMFACSESDMYGDTLSTLARYFPESEREEIFRKSIPLLVPISAGQTLIEGVFEVNEIEHLSGIADNTGIRIFDERRVPKGSRSRNELVRAYQQVDYITDCGEESQLGIPWIGELKDKLLRASDCEEVRQSSNDIRDALRSAAWQDERFPLYRSDRPD